MAEAKLTFKGGDTEVVTHQFGTVRRLLNEAATQKTKDGEDPKAFAEFHTKRGVRVLVNPSEVSLAEEIKNGDGE